ncbi:MAG: MoaD/ThiS family protein [Myxococcota bacterium]|nr:MoaD/ThiS family protein [Myxococcota bacterium]MEC8425827.1 MoaD/ThiS family protein [Myxococcota bacterium]
MQVHVRHFAVLRERRGLDEEFVEIFPGETIAGLYGRLFPPGPEGALPVAFSMDHAYVSGETVLEDGAEVAFIPPLGGG